MDAIMALAYSLICLLLLNAGWANRRVESWQRKCVYAAGWMSGIALVFCRVLLPNPLAFGCTAAFCALFFFGGVFKISPRWMQRCSFAIFLCFWGWTFWQYVEVNAQYAKWKEQTRFESMEQRVPEPKPGYTEWSKEQAENWKSNNTNHFMSTEQIGSPLTWYGRQQSIEALHNSTVSAFNKAAGFGSIRMMVIHPLAEHFLPDAVQPIRQQLDDIAELVSNGENSSDIKTTDVAMMNAQSTANFANPGGYGLVKSRSKVAGFQPHRFSKWPDAPQNWDVKRIDLVSLLLHDEPVVYVSNDLPRMADVGKLTTRELDTFEKDGLSAIRKGEELHIRGDQDKVRVVGAMRNFDHCMTCHGGKTGDLLGAFSYVLIRQDSAK
jgi:hypothetical protein